MQQLKAIPFRIEKSVLAKITIQHQKKSLRKDYAFLDSLGQLKNCKGYACVLIPLEVHNEKHGKSKLPLVVYEQSNYVFNENDIIRVLPEEKSVSVLFESNQNENCLYVTDSCNSRCVMCPQEPKPDIEDYISLNNRIISLIENPPEYITITGGEPTLLGENLTEMIRHLRKQLPSTKIMVLTNARKFSDERYVEKIAMASDGHVAFAVPIYSDNCKKHDDIVGVTGAFSETLNGCHNLALYRLPVEIRVVVLKKNYRRLDEIARYIYRNLTFAFHVTFMGLEMHGLAKKNFDEVWVDPYDYRDELLRACKYLFRRGLNVSLYNHQLCLIPKELWPISVKSITRWKNIYLPICEECDKIDDCGGFFGTSQGIYSSNLSPF